MSEPNIPNLLKVLMEDEIKFRQMVLELQDVVNKNEQQERRLVWLREKIDRNELEQEILRNRMEERGE